MRKILFSRNSDCIQPLRTLIEKQTHKTLILWALDCAERFLSVFEKAFPDDTAPRNALNTADRWASGEIKMPVAKAAIHACHNSAAAAENNCVAQAAARAVGHAAATVHTETHALGVVFYGLTALLYQNGIYSTDTEQAKTVAEKELKWFYDRLLFWQQNTDNQSRTWAEFLQKTKPNKELLLRQKQQGKPI